MRGLLPVVGTRCGRPAAEGVVQAVIILGAMHRTRDGRAFFIDSAQLIPSTGNYDVVLYGLRRDGRDFSMGVAFPPESVNGWGARDSMVREGLVHLREQLDHGVEEDGLMIEIPVNAYGGWHGSYRFAAPSRRYHA